MLLEERLETPEVLVLVRRAQAGDPAAFERLYRQEVGHVYAVCLRMAANTREAETLTQDTFVRAWRHLDSFRGESAFSTWLHRIAVNVVLGAQRSARRREARVRSTDDLAPYDAPATHPGPEARMDLEKSIAALPEQARAVLVLHDIEGYKHAEIGAMMGIAPGTSKAHLHRARTLLKATLAGWR